MAEFTHYAPGTPCWVELSSADVENSRAFYSGLFGWEAGESAPDTGGYFMFLKGGKNVAGCMPIMMEGQPTAWQTYVAVDDADATADKIKKAGGTVFVEPMDVLDVGRMVVFADPGGAALGLWQPRAHIGADLANEPGAFTWNELQTRDTAGAEAFYSEVFGWGAETSANGAMAYTEWKVGERSVAGMMDMPAEVPPETGAYWLVYF
ncbi:MAG TPA: VOC family protein, partial [Acidimicrobiales bacterium]|nr:VOC family protein [Acidimicrobiales bacterium]